MQSQDAGHLVQQNSRPAVQGFAEFCCSSPALHKNKETIESHKVSCTRLEYTYPLKLLVASRASSVPSCQWLYIITFGGGLVEGDNVSVDVTVGELCTAVVTTQASTKVYNSDDGLVTKQGLRGCVADGGLLAVLPDPVVCFKNAIYNQQQDFELTTNGSVVVLDWFTAGRIALGEVWDMTSYKSHNRVFVDGRLVYGDSISLGNANSWLSLKESMCGSVVLGSCIFIGPYFKEIKKGIQKKVNEMTKCSGMHSRKKEVMAFASIIDPTLCDGVVVKLITTQSTEQITHSNLEENSEWCSCKIEHLGPSCPCLFNLLLIHLMIIPSLLIVHDQGENKPKIKTFVLYNKNIQLCKQFAQGVSFEYSNIDGFCATSKVSMINHLSLTQYKK